MLTDRFSRSLQLKPIRLWFLGVRNLEILGLVELGAAHSDLKRSALSPAKHSAEIDPIETDRHFEVTASSQTAEEVGAKMAR